MRFAVAAVSAGAGAIVALLVTACGSSSHHSQPTASRPQSVSAVSTPAPARTASQPTTGATRRVATAPTGPALCRADDLALSYLGGEGATGHGVLGFSLTNNSDRSCSTSGYPGVLFLSASGQPLRTDATRTTNDFVGPAPVESLVLAPGQSASFRVVVTHGLASSAGCVTAHGLQVIAPNDTATLRVSIPQGAFECGSATVSPLRPGSSAYP